MKKFKIFYLLFISALLMTSCCSDPSCPNLTSKETSWFPYQDYDTLIFKNNDNGSILKFPFRSYGNSANSHTRANGDECDKYCIAGMNISSIFYFDNSEKFYSTFVINKIADNYYVVFSPLGGTVVSHFDPRVFFDLRHAVKLDTLSINNNLLEDVYFYTCYPEQKHIAETYVKKGVGLVKIVFRDQQEYELIEHIQAK